MQYSNQYLHINRYSPFLETYHISFVIFWVLSVPFVHEKSCGFPASILFNKPSSVASIAWISGWYVGNVGKSRGVSLRIWNWEGEWEIEKERSIAFHVAYVCEANSDQV